MELLHNYQNGNVTVTLYDDGTKIQEWPDDEKPNPKYPNSMDIKITNYCDAGCAFCHEQSTIKGKHGDLFELKKIINNLPEGTELAIGGGNPLDHPNLIDFLIWCNQKKFVPNITVNYIHLKENEKLINRLIDEKLIYGLGLSIPDNFNLSNIDLIKNSENVVYHIIAGVNNISILDKIKNSKVKKVLILGYKEIGRGILYKDENVEKCKLEWYNNLPHYIGKIHLSFDNLAIDQLKIKRFFTKSSWKTFYMGSDGQFTMYIDLVTNSFATSSTSEKYSIFGNIEQLFAKVREINNF